MKEQKNTQSRISSWGILLIGSLLFSSCNDDEIISENNWVESNEGIFFNIGNKWEADSRSAKADSCFVLYGETTEDTIRVTTNTANTPSPFKTSVKSRGSQVTTATSVTSFDVASYYALGTQWLDFFTEEVTDGIHTSGSTYYWPQNGKLDFMAIAPAGVATTMPSVSDYTSNTASFTYAIPETVTNQKDIMVAVSKELNHSTTGQAVPLAFEHLLAGVQFKVGEMQFIKINSLVVSGVYGGSVTFTYNKTNNTWSSSILDTENTVSYAPGVLDTSGLSAGDEITSNSNNSLLLVAPQTTPESATLTVNYTELLTGQNDEKTVSIKNHNWEAGKTTIYSLKIGTTFEVTIPRPDDQDAHYIKLEMPYSMGALSDYVTSVTATAQWAKDENGNDISNNTSSKSAISLKFIGDLTTLQSQGYWTDELWEQTVTVETGKDPQYSAITKSSIVGSTSLNITGSALNSGTIVLFIEENNGTTDRSGELVLTATLKNGNIVTLGEGGFKQLCPSWNSTSIGVERFEESNTHVYGFAYNRKVTFKNNNSGIFNIPLLGDLIALLWKWFVQTEVKDDEGEFITLVPAKTTFGVEYVGSIVLDYSKLNGIEDIASEDEGKTNTLELYNFTGGNDLNQIETEIANIGDYTMTENIKGEGTPDDYAAFVALSRNRMHELKTTIVADNQDPKVSTKPYLYKDSNGNDIIEWYLPSSVEAQTLVETGTGEEDTPISPLNGTYWSSTAGSDANAYAHSYTFEDNTFKSINETEGRMEKLKVRAARKKP